MPSPNLFKRRLHEIVFYLYFIFYKKCLSLKTNEYLQVWNIMMWFIYASPLCRIISITIGLKLFITSHIKNKTSGNEATEKNFLFLRCFFIAYSRFKSPYILLVPSIYPPSLYCLPFCSLMHIERFEISILAIADLSYITFLN